MAEIKDRETIGSRLKRARLEAGLSQKQLANLSGVSQQMISKLESGKATETAQPHKLAAALGVRTDWLLTGQGPMRAGETVTKRQPLIETLPNGARRFVEKFAEATTSGALSPRKIELFEQMLDEFVKGNDDEKTDR